MDEEKKIQASFRIPAPLYDKLKKEAVKRKVNVTDVFVEALEFFLGDDLPGLCFKCKSQNPPDTKFCLTCGELLSEQRRQAKKELDSPRRTSTRIKELEAEVSEISKVLDILIEYTDQSKMFDFWKEKRGKKL